MRVAVISDIHGNALALEAVLADIERHRVDAILNLGDHFYGPLEPARTADILSSLDMLAIRGNTDRHILDSGTKDDELAEDLPRSVVEWLKSLPATATFEDQIFLSHGTPSSDEVYWLDRTSRSVFRLATPTEVEAELPQVRFPLYCCGHTHIARVYPLADGSVVFNPGSVGRPSFNMSDPDSARRASPDAAYALLARDSSGWSIDLRQVPYDHRKSSAIALANGSWQWAGDLLEGRRR